MPRLHRGLLWLVGEPPELDLLLRDPQIAVFVVARPHPGLAGFLPGASEKVQARLRKLGATPAKVEAP